MIFHPLKLGILTELKQEFARTLKLEKKTEQTKKNKRKQVFRKTKKRILQSFSICKVVFIILLTKFRNFKMQPNSNDLVASERPIPSQEDSEEKPDASQSRSFRKNKPIKKNVKSRPKESDPASISTFNQSDLQVSIAPFGIFESQTQKCQRLDQYFRRDIFNYYKTTIDESDLEILHNIRDNNLVELEDAVKKDLGEVWGDKISSLAEIHSYLELILEIRDSCTTFSIFYDEMSEKKYCCFHTQNVKKIIEINDLQEKILQNRRQFVEDFEQMRENYKKSPNEKQIKELNFQVIYLYKILYNQTKKLNNSIVKIQQKIQELPQEEKQMKAYWEVQSNYTKFLMRKMIQNSVNDEEIDYFNFFRDNEILEHNNGPIQNRFTEQREFQEFIKKKKNKKGRKAKYPLHSACLGCMSAYYEQYNPLSFCHECFVRFHKTCYVGYKDETPSFNKEEKDSLCQSCYNKKTNPNYKIRHNQCDYCNAKGLLHIPAGHNRRIHVFCMLINGLWTVRDNKVQFLLNNELRIPSNPDLKCVKCNSGNGYIYFCKICEKIAHPLCAFLGGWKIDVEFFDQATNKANITLQCCGVPLVENEKRRKFKANFRRQAYCL